MKNLKKLTLGGTKVKPAAMEKLKAALPGLEVKTVIRLKRFRRVPPWRTRRAEVRVWFILGSGGAKDCSHGWSEAKPVVRRTLKLPRMGQRKRAPRQRFLWAMLPLPLRGR